MEYDLLVTGGTILDVGAGFSGELDIAVANGRIAAVEPGISPDRACSCPDAQLISCFTATAT